MITKKMHLWLTNAITAFIVGFLFISSTAIASASKEEPENAENAMPVTGYYEMKPFLTNLSNNGTKLNYIRVSVVISVTDSRDTILLEEHDPLLRDAIVTILSSKTYDETKTSEGNVNRLAVQAEIKKKLTDLTDECVGRRIIKNVIFTDYLVQ